MNELRIAFDARYISDRYHGIGRYAFRLLEALVDAAPDATFVVFRGRERDSRFDWESLAVKRNIEIHAGPWPLYWPQEQVLWPHLLRRARVDLFHTPYFVVPLFSRVPAINTIHDLIFERYPAYMPMRWSRPYYQMLMASALRRARRVVAVSHATAGDLRRYYDTGSDRAAVITEGVDPHFRPVGDVAALKRLRERYKLVRPFVLSVGTRRPHKNLRRLVQAYGLVSEQAGYDLIFAGTADERFADDARQEAQASGLNGKARFLDWVPEADLPGLYTLADVAVVPSLVEGFGLPALEAMACGTAVVAANASSLPEVVGHAGLLVDPYNVVELAASIKKIMGDAQRRRHIAEAGRVRAGRFRWNGVARQVLQIYAQVLS